MSVTCQTSGSQVIVVGGRTANTAIGGSNYDSLAYLYDMNKQATASTWDATPTTYAAPASIRAVLSSASTPSSWTDVSVQSLFSNNSAASTTSPASPSATASSTVSSTVSTTSASTASGSGGLSGGAVAGIAVGVAVLIILMGIVGLILWRRRRADRASNAAHTHEKAELPDNAYHSAAKVAPSEMPVQHIYHQLSAGSERWELDTANRKTRPTTIHELN